MVIRVQLNLEIDTTSREVSVVDQKMSEGAQALCLSPGCGKPATRDGYYCSQLCFRTHRPRRRASQHHAIADV